MNNFKIRNVFYNEIDRSKDFSDYDSSYLFTTENIKGYMPNLEDKDILTVCSSGDHYLNAVLHGAKNIDVFDINKLTLMTLKLKMCAIKNIDYELFLDYFGVNNKDKIFDYNIYKMFSKYLDYDTLQYFNYLYEMANYSGNFLYYATGMFYTDRSSPKTFYTCNDYLASDKYFYLSQLLFNRSSDVNFIHSDVNKLSKKLNKCYDAIFLSNIQDYQNPNTFLKTVCDLKEYLKDNGSIYFAYCYHATVAYFSKIYKDFVTDNPDVYSIFFDSIYSEDNRDDLKDKVLVLGKF